MNKVQQVLKYICGSRMIRHLFLLGCVRVLGYMQSISSVYAYDSQVCQEYDDGVVCATLDQRGDDYEFEVRVHDYYRSGLPTLRCDMRHSSSSSLLFEQCEDEIRYTGDSGSFLIEASLDGITETFVYDVNDEDWTTSSTQVSASHSGGGLYNDLEDIRIFSSSSQHELDTPIDIDVQMRDDQGDIVTNFTDEVSFQVEERSSNGSYFNASSSHYTLGMTAYKFRSYDDGEVRLSDLIEFHDEGGYRLKVYVQNDSSIYGYEYFTISHSSSNSTDADRIDVDVDDRTPGEYQEVCLRMEVLDNNGDRVTDYREDVDIVVYRESGSSWTRLSSSSSYFNFTRGSDVYRFSSSDDGLENDDDVCLEFTNDFYDYKIEVEDQNDSFVDGDVIIRMSNTTSSSDLDRLILRADDNSPVEDERVYFDIEALDSSNDRLFSYRGTVRFRVYRRSPGSFSWSEVTSSSDNNTRYEISDHTYRFTSSDDGLENDNDVWIEIKNDNYDWRIEVEDEDNSSIDDYVILDMAGSFNDVESFDVRVDDEPREDERIEISIEALDDQGDRVQDYTDQVRVRIDRRCSSCSSWTSAGTSTNTSYYRLEDTRYDFRSSDDGYAEDVLYVEFKNDNFDYRIRVYDSSDSSIEGEEIVYMTSSSTSSDDIDEIVLRTNDSTPDVDDQVDLIVELEDASGYRVENATPRISFDVFYRDGDEWRRTTSSSYVDSNYDQYTFRSSDDGYVRLHNAIEFKRDLQYKVTVELDQDTRIDDELIFTVGDADEVGTTTDDAEVFVVDVPTTSIALGDRIDVTIDARTFANEISTRYRGDSEFSVQEVVTPGVSNRRTPFNGDYTLYLDDYEMDSSDDGQAFVNNLLTFDSHGYYRIMVEDDQDPDVFGYAYVFVPSTFYDNSVSGFSSSDLLRVRAVYQAWDKVMNRLMDSHPTLIGNNDREDDALDFYRKLQNTVRGGSQRFTSYADFYDELRDFVVDTAIAAD